MIVNQPFLLVLDRGGQCSGSKWRRFQIMVCYDLAENANSDALEVLKNSSGHALPLLTSVLECWDTHGPSVQEGRTSRTT